MAWCASFQLGSFGECRKRFVYGVLPRCALCPLFDSERAIRAGLRDDPAPRQRFQISPCPDAELIPEPDFTKVTDLDFLFNPDLLAQLDGELPDWMDLSPLIPDYPPAEWGESLMSRKAAEIRQAHPRGDYSHGESTTLLGGER